MVRNTISTRTEEQVSILLQKKARSPISKANFVSHGLFTHPYHRMMKNLLTFCLLHPLHNTDIKLSTVSHPFSATTFPPKPALVKFPSNIMTWQSWLMLLGCWSALQTAASVHHALTFQAEVWAKCQPWLISWGSHLQTPSSSVRNPDPS